MIHIEENWIVGNRHLSLEEWMDFAYSATTIQRNRGTLPGFAGARGKVLLIINLSKPEKARVH